MSDPTDLPFLEAAVAGHADAPVTGNVRRFTPGRGRREVAIVTPAELVRCRIPEC